MASISKTSILIANYLFPSRDGGGSSFLPHRHDIRYLSSGLNLAFDCVLLSRVLAKGILRQKLFKKRKDEP